MTITLTAFERSPDDGKGLARDTRVRWALEEVGQPLPGFWRATSLGIRSACLLVEDRVHRMDGPGHANAQAL